MKILGLLTSDAHGGKGNIPQEDLFPVALQAPLAEAIGEDVEIIPRAVWPNPGLERVVARWMDEHHPELVVFFVSSFWFLYESTPVRIERKFGSPGRFISQKSQKVAATPWLAHNRVFQWGRKQTQRAIGGQAWFEPDEVLERSLAVMREVLRREGVHFVVIGPGRGTSWAKDEEALKRLDQRGAFVDDALREFCAQHHIEYWGTKEIAPIRDPQRRSVQGDQLHMDQAGHKRIAQFYFWLVQGWAKKAIALREPEKSDVVE